MWRRLCLKKILDQKSKITKLNQSSSFLAHQPESTSKMLTKFTGPAMVNKRLCHTPIQRGNPPSSSISEVSTQELITLTQEEKPDSIKDEANLFDPAYWQSFEDSEEIQIVDDMKGISRERGVTGVFDIEEFVELLKNEKLKSIAVIAVPPEINYVDFMVITTGRSAKQMTAVAEFIRKIFKIRAGPSDSLPVIEGKDNKDWIALDLGNIALHIFSHKTREMYDLETLWTCGADFDDLSNQEEQSFSTKLLTERSLPSQQP